MKFILNVIFITLTSLISLAQTEKKSFPDSGFSATFPASLKIETNAMDSQFGKVNMLLYLAEGEDYMIMLSESKFPVNMINAQDEAGTKKIIEGARNGALNNFATQMQSKYESKSNEDFLFDGKYQGNKFTGSVNEIEITGTTFIKNNQMYQILVIGNTAATDTITFLNSFTLTE